MWAEICILPPLPSCIDSMFDQIAVAKYGLRPETSLYSVCWEICVEIVEMHDKVLEKHNKVLAIVSHLLL